MANVSVDDVRVEAAGQESVVVVPARVVGSGRMGGMVPLVFGGVFAGIAGIVMWGTSGLGQGPVDVVAIIESLVGLPFLVVGVGIMGMSLRLFFPRETRIVVGATDIRATYAKGVLKGAGTCAVSEVAGFEVRVAKESGSPVATVEGLVVKLKEGGDCMVAPGYEAAVLAEISRVMCRELLQRGVRVEALMAGEVEKEVAVAEAGAEPVKKEVLPAAAEIARPEGTTIQAVITGEEMTFLIPRSGWRGTAGVIALVGGIFGGMGGILFVVFLLMALRANHADADDWIPVLGLTPVMGIGVLLLLLSVQVAYRVTVLVADGAGIVFTTKGPLRNREETWKRETLAAVRSGDSGTRVNDHRLQEVQVFFKDGEKRGVLGGKSDEEVEWVAETLRSFYGIPEGT